MATTQVQPPPGGGGTSAKPAATGGIFGAIIQGVEAGPALSAQQGHNIFVKLIGETIGVMVLAVIADMNENVGKIIVTIMVGWLLLFLAINGQWFNQFIGKV